MKRFSRAFAAGMLGITMALAAPASAGDLSVSIVGDGYIVNPGPGAEVVYYGPQGYVAPPYGYGYGYGYPPPPVVYGPPAYGYYGAPPAYYGGYAYGGPPVVGYYGGIPYGRRGFRLR